MHEYPQQSNQRVEGIIIINSTFTEARHWSAAAWLVVERLIM
jgi:hypothetical protein